MHPTLRLLTARLAPFTPTGVTGVLTHPNPRPTLIAVYNHTLTLLSQLPTYSVYRQSTENLTRHRLSIIEAVKPAGYEDYKQRLEAAKQDAGIKDKQDSAFELGIVVSQAHASMEELSPFRDDRAVREYISTETTRWKFPPMPGSTPAEAPEGGLRTEAGAAKDKPAKPPAHGELFQAGASADEEEMQPPPLLPLEPPLTEEQVSELEQKFGSGLLEQVIEQGWAELSLVADMEASKIWEELEFVPEEGQWVGFEKTP